jgi:hypothetical protein
MLALRPSMRPLPVSHLLVVLAAVTACALALVPAAGAQTALEQYQRTGRINPCTASSPGGIPNDVEQYAPDFLEALRDAQRQGCSRGGVSQTQPTETDEGVPVASDGSALPPGSTYVPKPPQPPKVFRDAKTVRHLPLASTRDVSTPVPVIALAVMLLLALMGAAMIGTWRYMGWGVDRLNPVRHAFAEAGMRLGGAFSALADRLRRLGRRGA